MVKYVVAGAVVLGLALAVVAAALTFKYRDSLLPGTAQPAAVSVHREAPEPAPAGAVAPTPAPAPEARRTQREQQKTAPAATPQKQYTRDEFRALLFGPDTTAQAGKFSKDVLALIGRPDKTHEYTVGDNRRDQFWYYDMTTKGFAVVDPISGRAAVQVSLDMRLVAYGDKGGPNVYRVVGITYY